MKYSLAFLSLVHILIFDYFYINGFCKFSSIYPCHFIPISYFFCVFLHVSVYKNLLISRIHMYIYIHGMLQAIFNE